MFKFLNTRMSPSISKVIILILFIFTVIFSYLQISKVSNFNIIDIINNKKNSLPEKEVLAISDASDKVLILNKIIQYQNKFSDCIDELAKIYPQKGLKEPTPDIIEKAKRCRSFIEKEVTKTSENIYLVKYNQGLPENCVSDKTTHNFLNVEVNMNTKQTVGTWGDWANGYIFDNNTVQSIEKILALDCEAYAQYVATSGTLYEH